MAQTERKFPDLVSLKTPYDGKKIVFWEDPVSAHRIARAINGNFLKLIRNFEPQDDKFLCGPASIAIVLNTLKSNRMSEIPLDLDNELFVRRFQPNLPEGYSATFPRYTQKNLFEIKNSPKALSSVYGCENYPFGMSLIEMHEMVESHGYHSHMYKVTGSDYDFHLANISHALNTPDAHIIANFDRSVWGCEGNGHVSPIGAYDVVSNSVLVLDVNPAGNWLWIDLGLFMQSMTLDEKLGLRGYLIVT